MNRGVLTHRVTGVPGGVPVLLLNGGLMTFAAWGSIADDLERAFRVVAFDFRGMLLSPGPPPATLDGHVEDVVDLLDHLRIDRAHVVGTSFGGEVAVLLAAARPDRVRSLTVITATSHVTPEMSAGGQRLRDLAHAAALGGDGGAILDFLQQSAFSPSYRESQAQVFAARRQQYAAMPKAYFESLVGLMDALEDLDVRPALAKVECPTLIVGAELDVTFPPEHSRTMAAAIAGARLEIVAGSGHALVAEQPARLLEILWSFLPSA